METENEWWNHNSRISLSRWKTEDTKTKFSPKALSTLISDFQSPDGKISVLLNQGAVVIRYSIHTQQI